MGKQGAPPAPDYTGAAQQQAASSAANVGAQTTANRANQTNAFGASSNWTQGPNGQWTQSAGFGGPLGQAEQGLAGLAAGNAGQPIMSGDQARQQAVQGIYSSERQQLDPQWQQAAEMNTAQLANQGLDPTSAAARAQNNQFGQARNQAYGQALGQAEQQGTAAAQEAFGENLAQHNNPLQQLQALQALSGQSGYNAAGLADPTQYLQAANLGGQYGIQAAQMNNQIAGEIGGGIGGLVSGALPFLLG